MHGLRDAAVERGASDLFEDGRALIRCGFEEGGEAALGEQHGARETLEIHAGEGLDLFGDAAQLLVQDATAVMVGDLVAWRLQLALRAQVGAALTPGAAEAPGGGGEYRFGETIAGLPRHDLVAALGDARQPGRAPVEREAEGIEQGALAGAGRAGDGEQAVGGVGGVAEVDVPFADQRIEILEADAEDAHEPNGFRGRRRGARLRRGRRAPRDKSGAVRRAGIPGWRGRRGRA